MNIYTHHYYYSHAQVIDVEQPTNSSNPNNQTRYSILFHYLLQVNIFLYGF